MPIHRAGEQLRPTKIEDRARILAATVSAIIMIGRLSRGMGIRHLADLSPAWSEQHAALSL